MKQFKLTLAVCFITVVSMAQDVRLNDSVIFINNKPVALYAKLQSNTAPQPGLEVYSFTDYVLIKAEPVKFNAPVPELRPFYYYEITFPSTADTLAIFVEDQAFAIELANIIKDFDLIKNNEINKTNVSKFVANYYGGFAFREKVRSFTDFLNDTRYFNEQVVRDRTKPVSIVNGRVIMQDGVKIGLLTYEQDYILSREVVNYTVDSSNKRLPAILVAQYETIPTPKSQVNILLTTERKVELPMHNKFWTGTNEANPGKEKSLYHISMPETTVKGNYSGNFLGWVCYLIENYFL